MGRTAKAIWRSRDPGGTHGPDGGVEAAVSTAKGDQSLMRTLFRDAGALNHHDAIGMPDGRGPMRDHPGGPPLRQFRDRLLDLPLGCGKQVRKAKLQTSNVLKPPNIFEI